MLSTSAVPTIHEWNCTQDGALYLKVKPELVNSKGVGTGMVLQYSRQERLREEEPTQPEHSRLSLVIPSLNKAGC